MLPEKSFAHIINDHTEMQTHKHMHAYTHTHTHTHTYTHTHTHTHTHCTHTYTKPHTLHTYIYKTTHTNTHTLQYISPITYLHQVQVEGEGNSDPPSYHPWFAAPPGHLKSMRMSCPEAPQWEETATLRSN